MRSLIYPNAQMSHFITRMDYNRSLDSVAALNEHSEMILTFQIIFWLLNCPPRLLLK